MAQLSPITLVYDQIAMSIAEMLKKQAAGEYVTKEDVLKDFKIEYNLIKGSFDSKL